jgi:hypothetical protein
MSFKSFPLFAFFLSFSISSNAEIRKIHIVMPDAWIVRFFDDGSAKLNYGSSEGDDAETMSSSFVLDDVADELKEHLLLVEPWPKDKKHFLTVSISHIDRNVVDYYVPKSDDKSAFIKVIRRVIQLAKPWDRTRFEYLINKYPLLGIDAAAFREIQASKDPELDLTLKPEPSPRAVEPTKSAVPVLSGASDAAKPLLNGGASTTMLATGAAILLIAMGWFIYKVLGKRS